MKIPAGLARRLKRRLTDRIVTRRGPNVVIGGAERPYLRRWYVLPRNPVFNIYLHHFLRSDDDRALHDHPWLFNASILLSGHYREHLPGGIRLRTAGQIVMRFVGAPHRVELMTAPTPDGAVAELPCWTLFITGPRVREWGFLCPQGWRHWRDFTTGKHGETIGRGCGE